MNTINFLPRHYIEQQERRRSQRRQIVLMGVLLVCLAGWFTSSRHGLRDMNAYASRLEEQVTQERQTEARLTALRGEQESLQGRLTTQRELSPQVQVHHIMAVLARAMPKGTTLVNLRVVAPTPTPTAEVDKKGETEDARRRDERLAAEARRLAANKLQLEMIGLAPGDAQVASVISQFAQNPLFTNVKLVYCRAQQSGDLLVREFRIEMEVPLDREFEEPTAAPGAAHAN